MRRSVELFSLTHLVWNFLVGNPLTTARWVLIEGELAWVYLNSFNAHPLSFKTVTNIHSGEALMSTASSCTPGAPEIYFSMCNALVHVGSIVLSMIYKNAYTGHSLLFKSFGQVRIKIQRTNLYQEGSSFLGTQKSFNHFHNPHF